jgi:hypothetical protein
MTRTILGVPIWGWAAGVGAFGIAVWFIKRKQSGGGSTGAGGQPPFSQQQEIQDFQVFSQLTQSQQASDLSIFGQMLSLFGGGKSSGTAPRTTAPTKTTTPTPAPASTSTPSKPTVPGTTAQKVHPTTAGAPPISTATINGQQYYVIGHVQTGKYTGYNVSNGAPVYATWTGQGTPEQGFTSKTLYPGEVLYTPTSTPVDQLGSYETTSASL